MAGFRGTGAFSHQRPEKLGVLVANLGTPAAPEATDVRTYLREFLWDPRIVEMPRWKWWFILNGPILTFRPKKSAHAYQTIWTEAGSPLLLSSQALTEALRAQIQARFNCDVVVELGMRYGQPALKEILRKMQDQGVERVLVLPLYPQYSATTTASTFDAVTQELQTWRHLPEMRMVKHYHDHPRYIEALADSVKRHWQEKGRGEVLLLSFHSIPMEFFQKGDPYYCECMKTARLLAESLGLEAQQWRVSFQSRLGTVEWLRPYTDEVLLEMAQAGEHSVDVICPGFAVDCLETLEEIAIANRDDYLAAGGQRFEYIPALNVSGMHLQLLTELVEQHTLGWPGNPHSVVFPEVSEQELAERAQRVKAMGGE